MAETIALRDTLATQMKAAMKAGDKVRTGALRLMMAALKEREIEARGAGKIVSRADEMALLTKMVKQHQESLAIYEQAGREDLAAQALDRALAGPAIAKQRWNEGDRRGDGQGSVVLLGPPWPAPTG